MAISAAAAAPLVAGATFCSLLLLITAAVSLACNPADDLFSAATAAGARAMATRSNMPAGDEVTALNDPGDLVRGAFDFHLRLRFNFTEY